MPVKIYAVHKWDGSWLPLDTLLWLAKKQHRNGDYVQCVKTCEKIIDKYNDQNCKVTTK